LRHSGQIGIKLGVIYWLSFCDLRRPEGGQFLGAALIEADSLGQALTLAWENDCNPGGEVAALEIPAHQHPRCRQHLNRLMSREELDDVFGEIVTIDQFQVNHPEVDVVCACPACNGGAGAHTHAVN
jgi:hypothetical protein